MPKYKRVLLKLSGEALAGDNKDLIIVKDVIVPIAETIKQVRELGIDVGIVVGAGNIWRGKVADEVGMDRSNADYMGMIATIINAMALGDILNRIGVKTKVVTAFEVKGVTEEYNKEVAMQYLDEGYVVIFGGGTGKPFFSTDTCAALKAIDINADVILMAKNGVEGVYSDDPKSNPNAMLYSELDYHTILEKQLKVMDKAAVAITSKANMEIVVFNMNDMRNIIKVVNGDKIGTIIRKG